MESIPSQIAGNSSLEMKKPLNKSDFGGFTCVKCHIAFPNGDIQRQHFQSDWHRYNLKRNVADLPPVTAEAFRERVLNQRAKESEMAIKTHDYCYACKKTFAKHNAYLNHIKSKKHLDMMQKTTRSAKESRQVEETKEEEDDDEDMEVEEVDSDEWDEEDQLEGTPILETDCLFCSHHSANMDNNIKHMTHKHSFFIPDLEYCTDLSGLIKYLGEKVGVDMWCLYCGEKSKNFYSVDAVQNHMNSKGHCMVRFEGGMLAELSPFYDFSSSYPDSGTGISADEEVQENILQGDDYQLVLPSGATIGHRSLRRYYKQKLDPNRTVVVAGQNSMASKIKNLLSEYRSLGWKGATAADIRKRNKDLRYVDRMQKHSRLGMSVKANKFQTHFRPQVVF